MSFFAIMMLWFVFARIFGFRRRRFYPLGIYHRGHRWSMRQGAWVMLEPAPSIPGATPAAPRESAFEALKRRYVNGEIDDAKYEQELDSLLKTPEGRSQMV